MSSRQRLKLTLKRGALIAAANWPLTLVQTTADSLFKLLVAAPVIGGVFLVALVIGAEPRELMTAEWREMVAMIVSALRSHPVVLTAFLLAVAVVAIGGSLFVFWIKGGTVAIIVRAERNTGPIEHPPLDLNNVATAAHFAAERYVDAARDLFPRYSRLGFMLMAIYLASACAYLMFVMFAAQGWGMTALVTAGFVAGITLVNLFYLLIQIVIAAESCSVAAAFPRVMAFVHKERRDVTAVFLVILALVVLATGASLLATAALGLIAFVPFVGLAVLPLQLLAWVFRGVVFQYIGITSIGAYLNLYLASAAERTAPAGSVGQHALRPHETTAGGAGL